MFQKIARLSYWFAPLLLISLCPLLLPAQEKESGAQEKREEKAEHKPAHHGVTVTGCLHKGDAPGEFSITGEDGKTWELRSPTVKLAEHVGHRVSVTGFSMHESKAQEAREEKMEKKEGMEKKEKKEAVERELHLHVTHLKMISESCGKESKP